MKKIYLYSFAACLGFSLMACDGYKEPNPPAQSNPQLPILQLSDVNVENMLSGNTYDLTSLVAQGASIELAKVECNVLGAGYEFGANAYISGDDFATSFPVAVSSSRIDAQNVWVLSINPETLSNVYHENISWNNDAATIGLRYNLTTTFTTHYGTQVAIVGGSDNIYGPYAVNIQPLEADLHFYYLYTPGAANGWNQEASQWLYSTEETGPYTGYANLSAEGFKFTSAPNWDGTNYGASDEEGILSTDPEAGNLTVDEDGLYYCSVDVVDLNYTVTLINTIGLIGSATEGGWDNSSALEPSDDMLVWSATVYLIPGEYKFRANDAWDVNLGGDPNSLTPGGDNIAFNGEEGNYNVTLNLKEIPYSCTISAAE